MSNATVCSGALHAIFARPAGLNQFLLLVSVPLYDGEQLNLTRITRNEMGAYLCIATNGVPPTVSKRITVDVECEWISRYTRQPRDVPPATPSSRGHIRLSSYVYLSQPPARSRCLVASRICFSVAERIPLCQRYTRTTVQPCRVPVWQGKRGAFVINEPAELRCKGTRAFSSFSILIFSLFDSSTWRNSIHGTRKIYIYLFIDTPYVRHQCSGFVRSFVCSLGSEFSGETRYIGVLV